MALKMNQGKIDWTSALVARLKELWAEGVPTAKMARMLGPGVTKNAVIGKVHRLRLPLRHSPITHPRGGIGTHPRGVVRSTRHYARKKPRPIAAKAPPVASLPLPVPDTPPPPKTPPPPPPPPPKPIPQRHKPGTYTLLDLRPGECKWPVNDVPRGQGDRYLFCGEPQFNGWSYCEYHSRVGFTGTKRQASTAGWQPRQAGF